MLEDRETRSICLCLCRERRRDFCRYERLIPTLRMKFSTNQVIFIRRREGHFTSDQDMIETMTDYLIMDS